MVLIRNSKILIIILNSLLILGCTANSKPIFDLPTTNNNELNNNRFTFQISQEALPSNLDESLYLESIDLPNNAVYLSISQNNNTVSNFLLNVHIKDVIGIHDVALAMKFDPALLKFQFSSPTSSLIEGPITSRLRKFLPSSLMTLLAVPNPNKSGEILISNNIFEDLGASQRYQGILFSIPFQAISPGDFKTAIGFTITTSDIIDANGNVMDMQFFGGTITQKSGF